MWSNQRCWGLEKEGRGRQRSPWTWDPETKGARDLASGSTVLWDLSGWSSDLLTWLSWVFQGLARRMGSVFFFLFKISFSLTMIGFYDQRIDLELEATSQFNIYWACREFGIFFFWTEILFIIKKLFVCLCLCKCMQVPKETREGNRFP